MGLFRYVNAVLHEITKLWAIRDRSEVRSSVMPSAKYCCSRSSLRFVNGSTTIDRRGAIAGRFGGRHALRREFATCIPNLVHPNWPGDVLDLLLTHFLEVEIQPAGDIFLHPRRHTD